MFRQLLRTPGTFRSPASIRLRSINYGPNPSRRPHNPEPWRPGPSQSSPSRLPPVDPRGLFIWGIIGANVLVFAAWNLTPLNRVTIQKDQWKLKIRRFLHRNFLLTQENLADGRWWTLVTSAFSHKDIFHLSINMLVFKNVADIGFWLALGPGRMWTLALGSAVAGSVGSLYDSATRSGRDAYAQRAGLGASGMVQGMLVAMTCCAPHLPMNLMFIPIPISFWILTAGFIGWDYYGLVQARQHGQAGSGSVVGYAAHLGGAAFGAAFYMLRLRGRFGMGRF